jgi:hypothetical protein
MTVAMCAIQPQRPPKPGGAAPRVTKRRAETRANLIEAAFRVFADKGFGQVRIDDVCTAAGYTRGGCLHVPGHVYDAIGCRRRKWR